MPTDSVQAISLDAAGTLIEPDPSVGAIYAEVLAGQGIPLDPARADSAFPRAFRDCGTGKQEISEAGERRFWRAVVDQVIRECHLDKPVPVLHTAAFDALWRAFEEPCRWRLNPGAAYALEQLAARGWKVLLASNADSRFRTLFRNLGLDRHFDALVLSADVGAEKPSGRFFRAVAEAVKLPPKALLHIGDRPNTDYHGAIEAGLTALLYDPLGKYPAFEGPRLRSLAALPEYIGTPASNA